MMRLPPFRWIEPKTVAQAVEVLAGEGPSAALIAGGTDLLPNMKRRQQTPAVLVSLAKVPEIRGRERNTAGTWTLGAAETLRALERDAHLASDVPALDTSVRSISTPLLRNTGTLGGNVCLDTRCNYYDQSWEWRRAIDFCMKCEGETCWVAPSSPRCWAVNSSDSVPVLIALGARVRLEGTGGDREIPVRELFRDDGIAYLTKARDEVLTAIEIPGQGDARSVYRKVRRRGSFDFPVAAVAVRLALDGDRVREARIVLNAVGSSPVESTAAETFLMGQRLDDDVILEAATLAFRPAKPLDNTDHHHTWRKQRVRVEVKRALQDLHEAFATPNPASGAA